jgi:hypothetical protein
MFRTSEEAHISIGPIAWAIKSILTFGNGARNGKSDLNAEHFL